MECVKRLTPQGKYFQRLVYRKVLTMLETVDRMRGMEISVRSTSRLMSGLDPQLQEVAQWPREDGEGLLIRFSPSFYKSHARSYHSWRDTSWTVEVPNVAEAAEVKASLEAFFEALATGAVGELTEVLREFKAGRQA